MLKSIPFCIIKIKIPTCSQWIYCYLMTNSNTYDDMDVSIFNLNLVLCPYHSLMSIEQCINLIKSPMLYNLT